MAAAVTAGAAAMRRTAGVTDSKKLSEAMGALGFNVGTLIIRIGVWGFLLIVIV